MESGCPVETNGSYYDTMSYVWCGTKLHFRFAYRIYINLDLYIVIICKIVIIVIMIIITKPTLQDHHRDYKS